MLLRRHTVALAAVLAIAAAVQLLPLAAPLLLSRDAYYYWSKGRVEAVHGADPFVTKPSAFPGDVAYPRVAQDWRDRPSYYGPTMAGVRLYLGWIQCGLATDAMVKETGATS